MALKILPDFARRLGKGDALSRFTVVSVPAIGSRLQE
jgi:hypothetical protein